MLVATYSLPLRVCLLARNANPRMEHECIPIPYEGSIECAAAREGTAATRARSAVLQASFLGILLKIAL